MYRINYMDCGISFSSILAIGGNISRETLIEKVCNELGIKKSQLQGIVEIRR